MEAFLESLDPWLIYAVVAALTFGESAAFLSLVLPGEVGLVAAAALSASAGIDPLLLAGVATMGALVGGVVGYAIGRRYGQRLLQWDLIARRLGTEMEELRPSLVGSRAGVLVALARFNQVTRAIVPALAGMVEMGRTRFALANGLGALVWASVFTAMGYYAAEWWQSTSSMLHAIAAVVVVLGGAGWLLLRRKRRRSARHMSA
ncbi:MAG TPA: DedA family protein [Acidimicrobiia bacterium]